MKFSSNVTFWILGFGLVLVSFVWVNNFGRSLPDGGDRSSLMALFQLAAALNFVAMAYVERRREVEREINKDLWSIKSDVESLVEIREEQQRSNATIANLSEKLKRAQDLVGRIKSTQKNFSIFRSGARFRDYSMLLLSAAMFIFSILIILAQTYALCEFRVVDFLVVPALLSPCISLMISWVERFEMKEEISSKLSIHKSSSTRMANSCESGN